MINWISLKLGTSVPENHDQEVNRQAIDLEGYYKYVIKDLYEECIILSYNNKDKTKNPNLKVTSWSGIFKWYEKELNIITLVTYQRNTN